MYGTIVSPWARKLMLARLRMSLRAVRGPSFTVIETEKLE